MTIEESARKLWFGSLVEACNIAREQRPEQEERWKRAENSLRDVVIALGVDAPKWPVQS